MKHVLATIVAASLLAGSAPAQWPPLPPEPPLAMAPPAPPPLGPPIPAAPWAPPAPPAAFDPPAPPLPPLPPVRLGSGDLGEIEVYFQDNFPVQGPTSYPEDPADSLYRAARIALNKGDFKRAAQLFHQIPVSFSRSAYAPDAPYWEAFALYRLGTPETLRLAVQRLEQQTRDHPRASTRRDADALVTRIRGELARRGDTRAAERIERTAAAAAAPPPPRAPNAPQQACAPQANDMREAALNALLQMDAEQAIPIIRQVLARRDPCAGPLREKAVFLLAQKQTPETENTLLQIARSDPDPKVREQAVFWLAQVPGERSLDLLVEILRGSDDAGVREKAVFALSQHGSPRAGEVLRSIAEQSSYPNALREHAIFWLGNRGEPENSAYMRALYARLEQPALKEKAIFALAQMGEGNERWLMDLAANEREPLEMREKALFWAAQSQSVTIAELGALYDRMGSAKMREQIIFGLGQRSEAAALDKLIAIARSDRDQEMRKKALFWLGQSEDPRAVQLLLEILNQ